MSSKNPFTRWPQSARLVACFLFLAATVALSALFSPSADKEPKPLPAPEIAQPADLVLAQDPAPSPGNPAAAGVKIALVVAGVFMCAFASTTFGTVSGPWDTASLWSNGVPTSSLSAIVSATGGIPILPFATSAVTAKLSGAGTVGLCAGNVNKLKVVSPTASYVMNFCCVDVMEMNTSASIVPKGHG